MVICPDCGKEVKDAKFCSNCGSLLPKTEEVVSEEVKETVDVPVEEEAVEEKLEADDEVPAVEEEAVEEVADEEVDDEVPAVEEEAVEEVAEEKSEDVVNEEAADESVEEETADIPEEQEDEVIESPVEEETEETIDVVNKSKFCPNCGTEISAETAFCPQCGFRLLGEEKPQTKFCQNCGKEIDIKAEICPHCGVRVANAPYYEEKNVLLAAILSFLFPGLGQLYLGLSKKGISFILAYIVSWILVIILIGFILAPIVWIWSLVDAIKSTEAINRGEFVEDKLF